MKYAYVFGGKVNAIYTNEQYEQFVQSKMDSLLQYVIQVEDNVQVGWVVVDGAFLEVVAPLEVRKKVIVQKIKAMLNKTAEQYGFDNIDTACIYAGSDNAFQLLSKSFIKWRASIWLACEMYLQKVLAGEIQVGTDEEIIGSLPKITDFVVSE